MSASNVNNAAEPRQVTCKTLDKDKIPVDLDVLRVSGTFKKICDERDLDEHDEFPGIFPVTTISTHIFKKVIEWCKEHKDDPEPVVEKDPLTHECKWFTLTDYDKGFFDVAVPELIELINAADYLAISGLYHFGCQAVAARIKDKEPVEVRRILRQWADLSLGDYAEIRDRNPWLDPRTVVHNPRGRVSMPLDISNDVLFDVFDKLTQADLERLQMVNARFRDLIRGLGKEILPRRHLREVVLGKSLRSRHFVRTPDGATIVCQDLASLTKRIEFCAIEKLVFDSEQQYADELICALLPSKSAWKNASVLASPRNFSSKKMFKFAFSELLLCKEIVLQEPKPARFLPDSLLRLPAILRCNSLDIGYLPGFRLDLRRMWYSLNADDVVAWLEHERPEEWSGEPKQLVIAGHAIRGGFMELVNALKKTFVVAVRPDPYTVHIRMLRPVDLGLEQLFNHATAEDLEIRVEDGGVSAKCYVIVERK